MKNPKLKVTDTELNIDYGIWDLKNLIRVFSNPIEDKHIFQMYMSFVYDELEFEMIDDE